ncbi:hypothetical protein ACT691_16680 [Vibrio metschnikovii]
MISTGMNTKIVGIAGGRAALWQTVGVRYKPSRSAVIELEANIGEAHYESYAKARIFF